MKRFLSPALGAKSPPNPNFVDSSAPFFSVSLPATGGVVKNVDGFLSAKDGVTSFDVMASPPKILEPYDGGPVDFVSTTFAEAVVKPPRSPPG